MEATSSPLNSTFTSSSFAPRFVMNTCGVKSAINTSRSCPRPMRVGYLYILDRNTSIRSADSHTFLCSHRQSIIQVEAVGKEQRRYSNKRPSLEADLLGSVKERERVGRVKITNRENKRNSVRTDCSMRVASVFLYISS